MSQSWTEQELQRRDSMDKLRAMGINPYPAELFEINACAADIIKNYEARKIDYKNVRLAGRLMSRRIMGKASFAELQDGSGRIQLYFNRDEICPGEDKSMYNEVFKHLLDMGDIIGVQGSVFTTQTGEISVMVEKFDILTKSLRPLPLPKTDADGVVHDAFVDPEKRYRQRYVDLIVNPHVKKAFKQRSLLVKSMRNFLDGKGYMEVETPVLQPIYGGAAARPFKTHHNTLDMPLYLRIANELYLKRLIVGGFEGVYEFAKDFRNEGMSRFHNPEFTQMELYVAYKDYNWMMDTVEEMVERIAMDLHGDTKVTYGENEINFARPWKRASMYGSIEEFTGVDISEMDEASLRELCSTWEIPVDDSMGRGKLIDEIFGEKVEPLLIQPTFITDYPVEMSPLAKKHRTEDGLVERFEAICNGKEICNAFTELNDPIDQRARFEEQMELGKRGDEESMVLDEDFLRAIEFGMPPTAGLGIGIDRLAMIMTNSNSIQDVLFFPQMKPEAKAPEIGPADFVAIGVPESWAVHMMDAGFASPEDLKNLKATQIQGQLNGFRKKKKLDIPAIQVEEIASWSL